MTTYTAIASTEIDADSPITDALLGKLRDNPIAITEGASGAPRIKGGAHYAPVAGTVRLMDLVCGHAEVTSSTSTGTVTRGLPQSYFTALNACTIRVSLDFTKSGAGTAALVIEKNATAVQTYTSSTVTTYDVTLAAGDALSIGMRATGTSGGADGTGTLNACEYQVDQRSVARG